MCKALELNSKASTYLLDRHLQVCMHQPITREIQVYAHAAGESVQGNSCTVSGLYAFEVQHLSLPSPFFLFCQEGCRCLSKKKAQTNKQSNKQKPLRFVHQHVEILPVPKQKAFKMKQDPS